MEGFESLGTHDGRTRRANRKGMLMRLGPNMRLGAQVRETLGLVPGDRVDVAVNKGTGEIFIKKDERGRWKLTGTYQVSGRLLRKVLGLEDGVALVMTGRAVEGGMVFTEHARIGLPR